MPVAIANTTTGSWTGGASSQSISVTRAAGEGLFVGVYYEFEFGGYDTISSVVWDSPGDNQSMTLIDTQASNANRALSVYYLASPTSAKTANITVNFSNSNNGLGMFIVRHVTGHDTASPITGSAKNTGTSVTTSSATDDLVIDWMLKRELEFYLSADAPQADVIELQHPSQTRTIGSSTKSGAASVTMSWTDSNGLYDGAIIAASVKPAAAVINALNLYQRFNVLLRM